MGEAMPERIRTLYSDYIETAVLLEKNRKFGQGMFGIGKSPADNPCHESFVNDLAALLKEYARETPPSDELRSVLEWIYRAPIEHQRPQSMHWILVAAHGTTLELIPLLDAADAEALRGQYARDYRRWERLPVQKQVLSALEKRI